MQVKMWLQQQAELPGDVSYTNSIFNTQLKVTG